MAYYVKQYSGSTTIIDALDEINFGTIKHDHISENKHFDYLQKYMRHMKACTIIVESDYIDRDFLDDYSNYYAKCFNDYQKKCARVHFFSFGFQEQEFNDALTKANESSEFISDLQTNYLGFVVLKPIPFTMFGRTCLKSYSGDDKYYLVTRKYAVHLCGIELEVTSLAFQEQDRTVSACATSALWSAFQSTGILFHHSIPSPYKITERATQIAAHYTNRTFPNNGLQLQQMAFAVKETGLEPILLDARNNQTLLKACVNAYLQIGIPIIMAVEIKEEDESIGLHAITIAGFKLCPNRKNEISKVSHLNLISSHISALYVHDDQVGPFASLEFISTSSEKEYRMEYKPEVSWNESKAVCFHPSTLLIPGYNKIRVSFLCIYNIINNFVKCVWNPLITSHKKELDLSWDIHLSTQCPLKKEKLEDNSIDEQQKIAFLKKEMPQYIWVADAYNKNNEAVLSFYFDATDTENAPLFLQALHYTPDSLTYLKQIGSSEITKKELLEFHVNEILQKLTLNN